MKKTLIENLPFVISGSSCDVSKFVMGCSQTSLVHQLHNWQLQRGMGAEDKMMVNLRISLYNHQNTVPNSSIPIVCFFLGSNISRTDVGFAFSWVEEKYTEFFRDFRQFSLKV